MIRLLVCDDAVAFSLLLDRWLNAYEDIEIVGTVSSAADARRAASELRPDVILLDHLLPDADSQALVPELRALLPDAGIVLISGMTGSDLLAAAQAAGADGFVSKASRPDELYAAITHAARR